MMKKLFTFALSFVTLAALSGCSSKEGDGSEENATYEDEAFEIPDGDDFSYEGTDYEDNTGLNLPDGDYQDEVFEIYDDDEGFEIEPFETENSYDEPGYSKNSPNTVDEILVELENVIDEYLKVSRQDPDSPRAEALNKSLEKLSEKLESKTSEMSFEQSMRLFDIIKKIDI